MKDIESVRDQMRRSPHFHSTLFSMKAAIMTNAFALDRATLCNVAMHLDNIAVVAMARNDVPGENFSKWLKEVFRSLKMDDAVWQDQLDAYNKSAEAVDALAAFSKDVLADMSK